MADGSFAGGLGTPQELARFYRRLPGPGSRLGEDRRGEFFEVSIGPRTECGRGRDVEQLGRFQSATNEQTTQQQVISAASVPV